MAVFSDTAFDDHERVLFCRDAPSGLSAIIALHSTALGPAAGGCRLWSYASDTAALHDVLRLSRGMSYKNAMAGLEFGGGKAVIIKPAGATPSDAAFERFGEFVDTLAGDYITAEDVGMSERIMQTIARRTRFVTGLPRKGSRAGGDPSPKTADGIVHGIRAAMRFALGTDDLAGKHVAVQGVGNVGYQVCRRLAAASARLSVADIDSARTDRARAEFGADVVPIDDVLSVDADVVSPCALGAVLNSASIPTLRARIVAGGANNQLASDDDGRRLADAGVLYAPDYVINAGGIINVACEYLGIADDAGVDERVAEIGPRLTGIFETARATGRPTNFVADEAARGIIARAGQAVP